jgi:hypothetical protein
MSMRSEYNHKFNPDLVEMNEKLRKEAMRAIEVYGRRQISDLPDMSDAERSKWFFWNVHENLDELRKYEPALIGQVRCTQMTVCEVENADGNPGEIEKRLSLNCKWHLRLVYSALKNDDIYSIGDGASDILISATPPTNPSLQKNQKGYLHADSSLYPNQIFMYGWISEAIWKEVKDHLYDPSPNCQADILLRDNGIFPVKSGFDFVVGPPGSVGITSMEFRVSSSSGERRMARRGETLQR